MKWIVDSHHLYLTVSFKKKDDQNEMVAYQIMDMETAQEFEASHNSYMRKKEVDHNGLRALESRVLALYDLAGC